MSGPIVCPGHNRPLASLHYSDTPDGLFLISGCLDAKPMLRCGDTGDWIGTFVGHKGAVWSAKLNVPATRAATGGGDFSAKVWDAISGDELHSFNHKHIVKTVDFSKDSSKLLTGGQEKVLRVFDLGAVDQDPVTFEHPNTIRKALWCEKDGTLITGCDDGMLRLYDMKTNGLVKEVSVGDQVMDMEFSVDGRTLTVAAGKQVHFLDASTYEITKSHVMDRVVEGASLHPGNKSFLAGGTDLWVRVYDFETGAEVECHKGHHGPVHCLRYSPKGINYSSGADDATIRIWRRQGDYEPEENKDES